MDGKSNKIKKGKDDLIFESVNNFLVLLVFIIVLYPLVFVASASISNPDFVNQGEVILLPKGITFEGYLRVFSSNDIGIGYRNTIFYTILGTFICLFFTLTAAYSLSREDFVGKKVFVYIFTFTMFFSGGLIPYYLVVKTLGLVNTIWAQTLLGAVGFWNIVIVRTFYQKSIPAELKEAAFIDGCSNAGMFIKIILPLSKPIIAVIGLYAAVGQWNSFFNALIFITDRKLYTLQLILREILILNEVKFSQIMLGAESEIQLQKRAEVAALIKYSVMIVSTLPIIMAYPFVQKYFTKGVMVGSLKG
ncbi:MAG: carbohydrate ABC transporter permease [Firmicutes bacterium]|nr:carbohydrate ABC transporter permease [Bacillota bacterium]